MYKFVMLALFAISIVAMGCEKNMIETVQASVLVEGATNPAEQRAIAGKMGAYAPGFTLTDGFQQLDVYKSDLYQGLISPTFNGYQDITQLDSKVASFFFNGKERMELLGSENSVQQAFARANLGKTVTFSMQENGEDVYQHDLYVPKEIVIDLEKSGLTPSSGGVINLGHPLYINEDINNENGLLLTLWYQGEHTDMTMDDIQNNALAPTEFTRHLYIPEDNGRLELPTKFFEGIPNKGMFYLQIYRSNFHVFDLSGRTHKLQGGNSYGIQLVLNR